MKQCIIFVILAVVVVFIVSATEFSIEDTSVFVPFIVPYVAPPPCPPNELFNYCRGNCSDCIQRGRCLVTKCEQGCDCAPRFFRLTPGGPCEPVANCPIPECGANETFRECGPLCERCTSISCNIIVCEHKCFCKEGYRRNAEGICILKDECPIRERCCRSEEWAERGPVDEFCTSELKGDSKNITQNKSQCYCKKGKKRNFMGFCVSENTCPMLKCTGGEIFHQCIPKCNTTCRNYDNPDCTEDDNCYAGCFCPPGYVMNDFRACIPVKNCSLDIVQVKIMEVYEVESSQNATTKPTPPADDNTSVSDDSIGPTSKTIEYVTMDFKDTTTTLKATVQTARPTKETPISNSKEKSQKKGKSSSSSEANHENRAKEKDAEKDFPNEEDDFDNEEI